MNKRYISFPQGRKSQKPYGFGSIGAYTCKNLQANLMDYFGRNVAQMRSLAQVSLIKWLTSPQNTNGFRQIDVESVPGKKRPVVMQLMDAYCFDLCKVDLLCNQTPVYIDPGAKEVVFDLTGPPFRHCDGAGNPVVLRFSDEDMMKFCTETDQSIIQRDIARYLLRFEQALDKALGTVFATQVGHNGADAALTNIPFWVEDANIPGLQSINPNAIWYLEQIYADMGLTGQFALIGGALTSKLTKFNEWTANNEAGVDMSKTSDLNPYMFYNRNIESIITNTDMILAAPGTVQLITWNKYKGEKRRSVTDLYTHGTVTLPTSGLTIDYEWTFDYKCKIWTYEAFLYAELTAALPGGCGAAFDNVNGIIRVHDCSGVPVVPACPA